jgi:exopolysaccharide production protein ExoZ
MKAEIQSAVPAPHLSPQIKLSLEGRRHTVRRQTGTTERLSARDIRYLLFDVVARSFATRSGHVTPTKIISLQYLRAVAALCVLLYHAGFYLQAYRGESFFANFFCHPFGSFGVYTFFALSGLLMATQAEKLPDDSTRFLTHRIIRIYPALFLAIAVRVAVAWTFNLGAEFDPLTFSLAPLGNPLSVLGVEWTLVYEVCFYIFVFSVIRLALSRYLSLISLSWIVVLMCVSWSGDWGLSQPNALQLPLSIVCLPFALGLLIPELLKRNLIRQPFLLAGGLIFALSAVAYFAHYQIVLASLGCALIVAWFAAFGKQFEVKSQIPAKLGDWSFAIYLIHVPILTAMFQLLPSNVPAIIAWVLAVLLAIAIGCALGVIDVGLYQRLKRCLDATSGNVRALLCSLFAAAFVGAIILPETNILGDGTMPATLVSLKDARTDADVDKVMVGAGYKTDVNLVGDLSLMIKEDGAVLAGGWVNDVSSWLNGSNVIVIGSSAPAVLVPRDYQVNIIKIMGLRRYLVPVSFHQHIPLDSCPSGLRALSLAISRARKAYRIIGTIPCPT